MVYIARVVLDVRVSVANVRSGGFFGLKKMQQNKQMCTRAFSYICSTGFCCMRSFVGISVL